MSKGQKNTGKIKKVNEPQPTYATRTKLADMFDGINVSTLQEQEEEMRKYSASLSPEERMAYLQKLIQIAYAHVLNDPKSNLWDKNIYVTRTE